MEGWNALVGGLLHRLYIFGRLSNSIVWHITKPEAGFMWIINTYNNSDLRTDLTALTSAFLRLAHNMRAPPISVIITIKLSSGRCPFLRGPEARIFPVRVKTKIGKKEGIPKHSLRTKWYR